MTDLCTFLQIILLFVELSTMSTKCMLDTCSICSFRNSSIYGTCITCIPYQQTFQCRTAVSKTTSSEWKLGPCPEISSLTIALTIAACHVITDQSTQSWYIQPNSPCLTLRCNEVCINDGAPQVSQSGRYGGLPTGDASSNSKEVHCCNYFLFSPVSVKLRNTEAAGSAYCASLHAAVNGKDKMLGTDFYIFLLAMILAIVLLFMMVWHVSCTILRAHGRLRVHYLEQRVEQGLFVLFAANNGRRVEKWL